MSENINEYARGLLIKAGWNENRKVDRLKLQEEISKNGYEILTNVINFLEKYDGLIIKFSNLRNGLDDDITFDFYKASELVHPERIFEDYQPRIGKKLCIIGTAYREHYVLMMDEDGKVYGGYDNYLVKIGNSGIEAINAIINNQQSIEVGSASK